MALANKDSKILIVGGGGTIGSSTALHLARRGYTDVRILDIYQNPSLNSAGNDNNKLDLTSQPEREGRLRTRYEAVVAEGRGDLLEWLSNREEIVARAPHLKGADLEKGGWVAARNALNSVGHELRKLGVKSAFGSAGTFAGLLLAEDGKTVKGVKAVDGTEWPGDLVVFATGAWSPSLLDLDGQCAWIYAHIRLTPEEAEALKGIPTTYNHELGFIMEPEEGTRELKICNEFSGYTHIQPCRPFGLDNDINISVPRSHADNPTDTISNEGLEDIKRLVNQWLPHLNGRPFFKTAMCWCADTVDMNWLMCEHPKYKGLVVATGDSGQTFKMFPVVGGQVVDLIEGKLPEERKELWKWRPGAKDNGTGRGGLEPKDLKDVDGWNHDL
ncbi:hypothetical protein IAU60_003004 [Kwoniella sp. DSM 27419]